MTVIEKAYAKINLFLDVTGRRADGFHDIKTVMHSVNLCDTICLSASPSDKQNITISSSDKSLPTDESNLIYKAALKYLSDFNIYAEIIINLTKRIPIGAGLGGGSSDAAATLRALNRIYRLASEERLIEMSAELGSDVAFCLNGGCALCTGRGEKINPFKYDFYRHIVIAIGENRVSTPMAYALLDEKYGDFIHHNNEKGFCENENLSLYNVFESVIKLDNIDEIKQIMTEKGAKCTLMSGSGPAVFGGFKNGFDAFLATAAIKKQGYLAFKCMLI